MAALPASGGWGGKKVLLSKAFWYIGSHRKKPRRECEMAEQEKNSSCRGLGYLEKHALLLLRHFCSHRILRSLSFCGPRNTVMLFRFFLVCLKRQDRLHYCPGSLADTQMCCRSEAKRLSNWGSIRSSARRARETW